MKKTMAAIMVAAGAFSICTGENLITNPGFEEGNIRRGDTIVPGWKIRAIQTVAKYHLVVKESPKSGERCAKISIPKDAPAASTCYFALEKNPALEANKTYRFSFWAKNTSAKAFVRIVFYTSKGKYYDKKEIKIPADPNQKDWKQYSTTLAVKAPRTIAVMIMQSGHGEIYLDDFVLEEVVSGK